MLQETKKHDARWFVMMAWSNIIKHNLLIQNSWKQDLLRAMGAYVIQ